MARLTTAVADVRQRWGHELEACLKGNRRKTGLILNSEYSSELTNWQVSSILWCLWQNSYAEVRTSKIYYPFVSWLLHCRLRELDSHTIHNSQLQILLHTHWQPQQSITSATAPHPTTTANSSGALPSPVAGTPTLEALIAAHGCRLPVEEDTHCWTKFSSPRPGLHYSKKCRGFPPYWQREGKPLRRMKVCLCFAWRKAALNSQTNRTLEEFFL